MKKLTWKGIGMLMLVLTASIALIGCDLIEGLLTAEDLGETGTVTINLEDEVSNRTLVPDLDMDVASYEVTGSGPEGVTFDTVTVTAGSGATAEIADLVTGEWTFTVTAYNGDATPVAIGEGSVTVTIAAGDNDVDIDVLPFEGTGTFDLTITWPENSITDPSFEAYLNPEGDAESAITIDVADGATSTTFTDNSLEAGYYDLRVIPKDGVEEIPGTGFFETVRIVADQTTEGLYEMDIEATSGNANVTWTTNMQNPYIISLAETDGSDSGTKTYTADVEPAASDYVYTWYVNGQELTGQNSNSVDISGETSGVVAGNNNLDVKVSKNDVSSSDRITFNRAAVSFDSNGGDSVATQLVPDGETAQEPTAPTRDGYTFEGWYSDEELTTEYIFSTSVTAGLTLYAKWEAAQDTIVLTLSSLDDGSVDDIVFVLDAGPEGTSWSDYISDPNPTTGVPVIGIFSENGAIFFGSDENLVIGQHGGPVPTDSNSFKTLQLETSALTAGESSTAFVDLYDYEDYTDETGDAVNTDYCSADDDDGDRDDSIAITIDSLGEAGEYVTGSFTGTVYKDYYRVNNDGEDDTFFDSGEFEVTGSFNVLRVVMNE